MSEQTVVADVEGDGLLPTLTRLWVLCIGNPYTGAIDSYADQPGYTPLAEGLARLKAAERVVMHNGIDYDLFAINRCYPGTLRFEQVWDTMVAGRLLFPKYRGHSLEDWGVRLGHQKVEHDEWDRFSEAMAERCHEDVAISIKLFRKLWGPSKRQAAALDLEFKVQLVISLQRQNGFCLDIAAARELETELRQELTDIERELQTVYPPVWVPKKVKGTPVVTPKVGKINGKDDTVKDAPYSRVELQAFNPGSRQQIEFRLKRQYGWKPTKFTDTGAAKLDESVLNDLAMIYPEADALARYFRVSKQLGQLADGDNAWLKLVTPEGRVHGYVNTMGTITFRMSHNGPNMGQVDKKDKRMRAVWISRKGWKLVGCDAEGIEARAKAHYLAKYDGGAFIKTVTEGSKAAGTDLHTVNLKATRMWKRDEGTSVKNLYYGYLYGAGNKKLGLIMIADAREAGKYTHEDSPWLFGKNGKPLSPTAVGKEARERLEKGIVGLDKLIRAVRAKHKDRGCIIGPAGHKVYTRSEHASLNTLLQHFGAVVMKMALVIFHFELAVAEGWVAPDFMSTVGFAYCANVHDEVQSEAEPALAEPIGQAFSRAITLAGERLDIRCPLAGAYDVGENWKETH